MRTKFYLLLFLSAALMATPLRYVAQISSSSFTPASLSGLVFWLNAGNAGSITQSGGTVSQWDDLSATAANFVQATGGNQPAYTASAINGQPGVDFTGTKWMTNSTALIGTGSTPFTIVIVSNFTSLASKYSFLMAFIGGGSGNDPQLAYSNDTGLSNVFFSAALLGTFGSVVTTTAFGSTGSYALTLTYNGSGPGTGDYTWYSSNSAQTTTVGIDNTHTLATNVLGAANLSGGLSNSGPICEFIIYSRVLNSTERGQVQTYVHGKYGL